MFNTTFVSWDENLKLINISALEMCAEKHWYKSIISYYIGGRKSYILGHGTKRNSATLNYIL